MGAFASGLQGIGGVGEDVAQGQQIYAQQKQQALMDKLNLFASQVKLKQLQDSMKQAGLPQSLGFTTGPNGEQLSIQRDPNTGAITTKQIVAGYDPAKIQEQAGQLISSLPEPLRPIGQGIFDMYAKSGDPMSGVKALGSLSSNIAEKLGTPKQKAALKFDKDTPYVTDGAGNDYALDDPNIPPELKSLADTGKSIRKQNLADEDKREALKMANEFSLLNAHEQMKARDEFRKTVKRGIDGHGLLRTIQSQVENAERLGGKGTQAGDLALTESYIQTMFGFDPKGVRNNQKLQESTLYQRGVDDRTIAWYHAVTGGGTLSQDVRQQMLDAAKSQIASWDVTVNMNGDAIDDPEIKKAQAYYNRITSSDAFAPNQSDLSDLGGKPVNKN